MDDKTWRDLILTKIDRIEEGQASMVEILHIHTLDSLKQNSEIKQEHNSLKDKVHLLWGAIIFVCGTFITALIGRKL